MIKQKNPVLRLIIVAIWSLTEAGSSLTTSSSYVVPDYDPPAAVVSMHHVPRITGVSDFNINDSLYMDGLVFIAVPFFFIGLASLVAFPLSVFVRNACPERMHVKKTLTRHEAAAKFARSRGIVIIAWIIVMIGILVLLSGNSQSHAGHRNAVEYVQEQAQLISDSVTDMDVALVSASDASEYLDLARDQCEQLHIDYLQNMTNCITSIEDWQILESESDADFLSMLEVFDIDDRYGLLNWLGAWVVVMFFCALMSFVLIAYCQTVGPLLKVALFFGWSSVPCAIVTLIAVWMMCGIAMSLAVGTSDFCMDPTAAILLLGSQRNDTSASLTEYYLTCEGGPGLDEPAYYAEGQCAYVFDRAVEDLSVVTSFCGGEAVRTMNTAISDLNQTVGILGTVAEDLGCESVNSQFVAFRSASCEVMATGMITLWSGLLLVGIFLFATLVSAPDSTARKQEALRMVQLR